MRSLDELPRDILRLIAEKVDVASRQALVQCNRYLAVKVAVQMVNFKASLADRLLLSRIQSLVRVDVDLCAKAKKIFLTDEQLQNLRSIKLGGCNSLCSADVNLLLSHRLPSIQEVRLSHNAETHTVVVRAPRLRTLALESFSRLRQVSVEAYCLRRLVFADSFMLERVEQQQQQQSTASSGTADSQEESDNSSGKAGQKSVFEAVEYVDLSGCLRMGEDEARINAIVHRSSNMRVLKLSTLTTLRSLNLVSRTLEQLDVRACVQLDTELLQASLANLPALRNLQLAGLDLVTELDLSGNTKLEVVNVSGCVSLSLNTLRQAAGLPHLRQLRLGHAFDSLDFAAAEDPALNFYSCPELRVLDLTSCRQLSASTIEEWVAQIPLLSELILNSCNKIQVLSVAAPELTVFRAEFATALAMLTLNCPKLDTLQLGNAAGLREIVFQEPSPELSVVDLNGCATLTDETSATILRQSPALQKFRLRACSNVRSFNYSSNTLTQLELALLKNVEQIHLQCPELDSIKISHCPALSRLHVRDLNRVTSLSLRNLDSLPEASLDTLLASCQRLSSVTICDGGLRNGYFSGSQVKNLLVKRCHRWTQQGVQKTLDLCPNLEMLELEGLSLCRTLVFNASSLKYLSITDSALVSISGRIPRVHGLYLDECKGLREIDFDHSESVTRASFSGCERLDDYHITRFAGHSPRISSLTLTGCRALKEASFHSDNIVTLDLTMCENLQNAAVQRTVYCCRNLGRLWLRSCKKLTRLDIGLRNIETLDLCFCTELEGIQEIINACGSTLKDVRLCGCNQLTTLALQHTSIKKVDLRQCANIHPEVLAALRLHFPDMQIIV